MATGVQTRIGTIEVESGYREGEVTWCRADKATRIVLRQDVAYPGEIQCVK